MRTVLLGSDLVYDKDGNLRIIEINTAVGITKNKVESQSEDIFDLNPLKQFITDRGFLKLIYIGQIAQLNEVLSNLGTELNLEYEFYNVQKDAVTIPFIEDSETVLIIRSAYDTTALVDDTYCRDKISFLELIKNESFTSQYAFLNENNELVSNITEIVDNGIHPNFILKCRYPDYDKEVYPKLYRVETTEELNTVLQNVTTDYYLTQYHLTPSEKRYYGKVTKIRSLNLLYPPSLESIPIGAYTDLPITKIPSVVYFDNETHQLDNPEFRKSYITSDELIMKPKLLDTDLVILADGTEKTGLDLQIGDYVKTIDIPNHSNIDLVTTNASYEIDYPTFVSGITWSTNRVVQKLKVDSFVDITKLNFTDGTSWEDTSSSVYLIIRNEIVQFFTIYAIEPGDKLILINNTETPQTILKEVSSVEQLSKEFSGWIISVERAHIFLTKTSENESTSFAAIEHNLPTCYSLPYHGWCSPLDCPKGQVCCEGGCGPSGYGCPCI